MPLPPAAEALRAQAAQGQARRNFLGGMVILSFVGSVFAYSILAVGYDDNMITEREVAEFRAKRELQRKREANTAR